MDVRIATEGELPRIAAFVAGQQTRGDRHIGYVGDDPQGIAADFAALTPLGLDGLLVAEDAHELVGVLATEWDTDPPRAWWHGPFVADTADFDVVADALLDAAEALLPDAVTQQELAPDERNTLVAALGGRRGFHPETASAALRRALPAGWPATAVVTVVPLGDADREAVAALHDRYFARSHLPGARVDEGEDRVVLVARDAGRVVGYVAAERQPDGSGYIDFLAVDDAARGRGVGAVLVARACGVLHDRFTCTTVHLTVREDRTAARRLYARLGFVEDRLIRPWRRGFSGVGEAAAAG
jgi:ribosomal protein S18 acetylase RimI-like enzyme